MADVYLARDVALDRQVALKVLFSEFADDASFVERFRREAKAAANLNHPNIVGIYDWGQEHGTYYIVMEYVEGRSIANVLRSSGPLHPDRAAEIAADVAGALATAHAAGLVHRDVKLGNVMVSDDGQVKVADFGIATALARRKGDALTQIGSVMGTATYFSPEQAQGKPLDGRSDLYSLGVTLYEMIVGKPPFSADTPTAVAVKHVQERPVPPNQAGVAIAESLQAIILKLLAKNPANRYPRATDLQADLKRYLAGAHSLPEPETATHRSQAHPATTQMRSAEARGAAGPHPQSGATQPPGRPPVPHAGGRPGDPPGRHQAGQNSGPIPPTGPSSRPGQPRQYPPGRQPQSPQSPPRSSVPPGQYRQPAQPSPPGQPGQYRQASPPGQYRQPAQPSPPGQPGQYRQPAQASPPGAPSAPGAPGQPAYYYQEVPRSDSWKRTALMLLGLAALLTVLGYLVATFYNQLDLGNDTVTDDVPSDDATLVELPDLSGLGVLDAENRLRALGLGTELDYRINTAVVENTIFAQTPLPGQRIEPGQVVTLTVSQGETPKVPPVNGRYSIEARSILEGSGYVVIEVRETNQAETGIVVRQEPSSGTELQPGEAVTITISDGPGQVFVPDVSDMTIIEAFGILNAQGFRVGEKSEPSETVPEGLVIHTEPAMGIPVNPRSEVIVVVSSGLPAVLVPDVTGLLFDTGD